MGDGTASASWEHSELRVFSRTNRFQLAIRPADPRTNALLRLAQRADTRDTLWAQVRFRSSFTRLADCPSPAGWWHCIPFGVLSARLRLRPAPSPHLTWADERGSTPHESLPQCSPVVLAAQRQWQPEAATVALDRDPPAARLWQYLYSDCGCSRRRPLLPRNISLTLQLASESDGQGAGRACKAGTPTSSSS